MSPLDAPAQPARGRSPALIVAGSLMLAAGLVLANPSGVTETRWPWQILAEWPWTRRHANWAVWFLAGILAIAFGATSRRGARAPFLLGAAVLLFVTCCSGDAGLALVRYNLAWFAGLSLLLAGFLLESDGRGLEAGRTCCVLGSVVVFLTLALSFDRAFETGPVSRLVRIPRDVLTRVQGLGVPDAPEGYDVELFANANAILAALLGLATLLGARGGLVGRIGLVLVALHFLVPTFHRVGEDLGQQADLGRLAFAASEVLIQYGLALCLFTAASTAELARNVPRPA